MPAAKRACLAVFSTILLVLVISLAAPAPTRAQSADVYQSWIHANAKDCCPHDRCFPVVAAPGDRRWNVLGFKSAPALGSERRWPFQAIYGCAYRDSPETIRCLFVPPPEAS